MVQGGALSGQLSAHAACISFQWSKFPTDEAALEHGESIWSAPLPPQTVVPNQGLHCAFQPRYIELCSDPSRRTLLRLAQRLLRERNIHFAMDTSPTVGPAIHNQDADVVNRRVMELNQRLRRIWAEEVLQIGSAEPIYLRDIETWNRAFHKMPTVFLVMTFIYTAVSLQICM